MNRLQGAGPQDGVRFVTVRFRQTSDLSTQAISVAVSVAMAVFFVLTGSVGDGLRAAERPPNVIVIFTDDQGSVDAGCYGASDLKTPGIDALADRGVRFSQFYAAAPVCSPSRAGLLTGRHPVRAGVPGNVSSRHGNSGMPSEQVTIAETLKHAGYATAHIGKWHLGYTPETMPNAQGFDHSFGHMGGCIDNYSHFFYWNGPNRHDLWRNGTEIQAGGRFFPDLMVEEAKAFMQQNREKPFFIYFAMNMPHYPYQGEAKWLNQYAALPYPRNLYAAFLSTLDERIQTLTESVEQLGLTDQTIIVFQSDHGHSCEERAHFGGGSAGPYRGAKFSLFEGGIRVPAVVAWPGKIPAGQTRTQVASSCDWLPTIAEYCHATPPDGMDGKSLVQLIAGKEKADVDRTLHWSHGKSWAVRQGPWKLIANPNDTSKKAPITDADREAFLVNLEQDVSELTNMAAQHPEIVAKLQAEHEAYVETFAN